MSEYELEFATRLMMLPALLIVGGAVVMVAAVIRNGKVAELRHRERMAMIEHGLTPVDPPERAEGPRRARGFKLTLGIMLCGFGLGLGMLIAFAAGVEDVALGVGGAFVMLGLAFIASALVNRALGEPEPVARYAAGPPPMPPSVSVPMSAAPSSGPGPYAPMSTDVRRPADE